MVSVAVLWLARWIVVIVITGALRLQHSLRLYHSLSLWTASSTKAQYKTVNFSRHIFIGTAAISAHRTAMAHSYSMDDNKQVPYLSEHASTSGLDEHIRSNHLQAAVVHRDTLPHDAIIVKTLLWLCDNVPVALVLHLPTIVDKSKLSKYMNAKKVKMLSREQAENISGQRVGSISPLGHRRPIRTLVDLGLVTAVCGNDWSSVVYGGGGAEGMELQISLGELVRGSRAEITDFSYRNVSEGSVADCPAKVSLPTAVVHTDSIGSNASLELMVDSLSLSRSSSSYLNPCATSSSDRSKDDVDDALHVTSKMLREAALRDDASLLQRLLQALQTQGRLQEVINSGTLTSVKTPLHLAAWKGSFECIRLLLDFGADINNYSKGTGNYGKTAIFYSITQCRDDVVLLLIDRGALVKVVNSKGQTPRSLGPSHLREETIARIEQAEVEQAQLEWMNFYTSHYWDQNTCFGDIDPRFHSLGFSSPGYCTVPTDGPPTALSLSLPSGLPLPRSLNETTFERRRTFFQNYTKNGNRFEDSYLLLMSLASNSKLMALLRANALTAVTSSGGEDVDEHILAALRQQEQSLDSLLLLSSSSAINATEQLRCLSTYNCVRNSDTELSVLIGCITAKRKMSRSLVFADLRPVCLPPGLEDGISTGSTWTVLSADTREEATQDGPGSRVVSIQLIIGKTLKTVLTEEVSAAICKQLHVGQIVIVSGRLKEPLKSVNRSVEQLDFIVHRISMFNLTSAAESSAVVGASQLPSTVRPLNESIYVIDDADRMEDTDAVHTDHSEAGAGTGAPLVSSGDAASMEMDRSVSRTDQDRISSFRADRLSKDEAVGRSESIHTNGDRSADRMDSSDYLSLDDIKKSFYPPGSYNATSVVPPVVIVRDETDFPVFSAAIDLCLFHAPHHCIVGIDCEWRPYRGAGEEHSQSRVALLQIAMRHGVFLVDLQTLMAEVTRDHQLEVSLDALLGALFGSAVVVKVGFDVSSDLERLSASYPDMPCFIRVQSVLDLGRVPKPGLTKTKNLSLSKLSLGLLGKALDKTQQTSEWHLRPLTNDQVAYASLDAAVLLRLFDVLAPSDDLKKNEWLRKHVLHHKYVHPPQDAILSGDISGKKRGTVTCRTVLGVTLFCCTWAPHLIEPSVSVEMKPIEGEVIDGVAATHVALIHQQYQHQQRGIHSLSSADRKLKKFDSAHRKSILISDRVLTLFGRVGLTADHAVNQQAYSSGLKGDLRALLDDCRYDSEVYMAGQYIAASKELCADYCQLMLHMSSMHSEQSPHQGHRVNANYSRVPLDINEEDRGIKQSPPSTTRIGGYILLDNTLLLFVNMLSVNDSMKIRKSRHLLYSNEFYDAGRYFSWFVEASQLTKENSFRSTAIRSLLIDDLTQQHLNSNNHSATGVEKKEEDGSKALQLLQRSVVLFVRQKSSAYMFCGRCKAISLESMAGRDLFKVTFELLDYELLCRGQVTDTASPVSPVIDPPLADGGDGDGHVVVASSSLYAKIVSEHTAEMERILAPIVDSTC